MSVDGSFLSRKRDKYDAELRRTHAFWARENRKVLAPGTDMYEIALCNGSEPDPIFTSRVPLSYEREHKRTDTVLKHDEARREDLLPAIQDSIASVKTGVQTALLEMATTRPYEFERELKRAALARKWREENSLTRSGPKGRPEAANTLLINDPICSEGRWTAPDPPLAHLELWLPSVYHLLPQSDDSLVQVEDRKEPDTLFPYVLTRYPIRDVATLASTSPLTSDLENNAAPLTPLPRLSDEECLLFTPSANIDSSWEAWEPCLDIDQISYQIVVAAHPPHPLIHDQGSETERPPQASSSRAPGKYAISDLPTRMEDLPNAKYGEKPE